MTEILDLSAADLVAGIRRRDFSAREAVAAHLTRIEEVNPVINAVITLDPEAAIAAADAADRLTASGGGTAPAPRAADDA